MVSVRRARSFLRAGKRLRWSSPGFTLGYGRIEYKIVVGDTHYRLIDQDGARHKPASSGGHFVSTDGTFITFGLN